jgi:hypothetical protein
MGRAARNKRNRRPQARSAERPGHDSPVGFRAGTPEFRELLDRITAETEMPCRAIFMDDPLFGRGRRSIVTGVAPDGDLITETGGHADRIPVLLFEPTQCAALVDPVTGQWHEPRIGSLVAAGWQRVPPQFIMAGLPADGWGVHRTATGVRLTDPYGCTYVESKLALDPEWISAAVSTGSVMVLIGPWLGIRTPDGHTPESYTIGDRAEDFTYGRRNGLIAAATIRWRTSSPAETTDWALLVEAALGLPTPPIAYVPALNLKKHGGPQAFDFTGLAGFGREPMQIPAARGLAARITDVDVDLVRPGDETGGFVAGYRNRGGPGDETFAVWRAAAVRHGHILVITGSRDILPSPDTDLTHIIDVIRTSHGAIVPLTTESVRQAPALPPQVAGTAQDDDQSEYSDLLASKLRSQGTFEVFTAHAVADLIDRDGLARWVTNLWPVACQTCGEPLGTKADISADGPIGDNRVLISMHHSACRPSGITPPDGRVRMNRPTSSFVAGYLAKDGKPSTHDFPVMVINPSCEQLLLERDDTGGWRNATLDEFAGLGLRPATGEFPPRIHQICADLRDDRLTVTIGADSSGGHKWAISPPPHVREQLRHYDGFALSLTTKALPTLLTPEDLPGAFNDPEALVGWVDLAGPTPQPRRRPAFRLPWPRTPYATETSEIGVDQTAELPSSRSGRHYLRKLSAVRAPRPKLRLIR